MFGKNEMPIDVWSLRSVALLAVLALFLNPAFAFSISGTQQISFGTIVSGSSGGSVTVSPTGVAQCSGGLVCLSRSSANPARFQLSGGAPYANFVVSLPYSVVLTDANGQTVTMDGFNTSLFGNSGQFSSTGNASFTVGATLHVPPGQAVAQYSGAFTVSIDYQ